MEPQAKTILRVQEFYLSEIDFHIYILPDMAYCNHVDDSDLVGHDRTKIEAMITELFRNWI